MVIFASLVWHKCARSLRNRHSWIPCPSRLPMHLWEATSLGSTWYKTPGPEKSSSLAVQMMVLSHFGLTSMPASNFSFLGADKSGLSTFVLCARWIVFITPLASVLQFRQEITGPLQGCVLCISCDGTVAIIAVDGFQLYVY